MNFVGGLPSGQGVFAHHPSPSDRVAAMDAAHWQDPPLERDAEVSLLAPLPGDVAAALMPLTSELAAAR